MIQKHKRVITLITATVLFALLSSSCSTLNGMGRDIRKLGRGVKNIVT